MDFSNYKEFFSGKRITLMGLGLLGRGVGDAEFLAQCGAQVHATDLKSPSELASSVDYLRKYPNVTYRLGEHVVEDFTECDMIIKAAGVPLNSRYIEAARAKGIPVYMTAALFAQFAAATGAKLIGVTGTRGKSTITHMIFHSLLHAGKRTILGGNVRGRSTLAKIEEVRAGDIAVLELDSWQLQGFGDLKISPSIAVFSNLMPDHLNYYPDMQTYFEDKTQIYRHQKKGDSLFVEASVAQLVADTRPPVPAQIPPPIPSDWQLAIPGEHNRVNASLAAGALRAAGLTESEIQSGIQSFAGIEGRLQLVRELQGVKIINDNNATTPTATLAALRAFSPEKTILILGGSDKGLDLHDLCKEALKCKKIILIPGTGTERIQEELPDAIRVATLVEALTNARDTALEGEIILFSPAFASFGMFKNEYDRNDQFLSIVRAL